MQAEEEEGKGDAGKKADKHGKAKKTDAKGKSGGGKTSKGEGC